jgi:uncharacterized protein (TIGR00251 family)
MRISVKVKPNSNIEEVTQDKEGYLVKVKDPPKEGKANRSVILLVAKYFKMPPSSVRIISGSASRNKIIEIL